MAAAVGASLEMFGFHPIINACGIYTDLGGSRLSPQVWDRMTESNHHFVRMTDLLESSGRVLASHLGAEAGLVTAGAAASITLMVSAAMTRGDGRSGERLPDTAGLPDEIVLQAGHRYKYDRQISMTGARLVLAGTPVDVTQAALEAAIGPRTAAVFVPAHLEGVNGTLPLHQVVMVARRCGIPVLVDAAYMCWPLEALPRYVATGADLVCVSAKYFGGPNAGGFIVGTEEMVTAVGTNNFTGYESGPYRTFGRPFKLDRQTIVGVVAAFEEWRATDHAARWASYGRLAASFCDALADAQGARVYPAGYTMDDRIVPTPVNAVIVEREHEGTRWAQRVAAALETGDPPILSIRDGNRLVFCLDVIKEEELAVVARRLRKELP